MPGADETITVPQATALINEVLGEYGMVTIQRLDHGLAGVEIICQGNGL